MKLLYGKPIADEILSRIKKELFEYGQKPGLAVILVGEDEASKIYVNLKEKRALEIGMNFFRHELPASVAEKDLLALIAKLNAQEDVHGIIVQLPLPGALNTEKIVQSIALHKDADGFLRKEGALLQPVFPQALLLLTQSSQVELEGKKALVLANSVEFGEVMCQVLEAQNLSSSYVLTADFPAKLGQIKKADVLVSAVGSPGLLKGEMFKEGAVVLDGGISKVDGKVVGDVDFVSVEAKKGFISPVPGGVGPVTIACLLQNVFWAFEVQQKEKNRPVK